MSETDPENSDGHRTKIITWTAAEWAAMSPADQQKIFTSAAETAQANVTAASTSLAQMTQDIRTKHGDAGVKALSEMVDGIDPRAPDAAQQLKERIELLQINHPQVARDISAPSYAAEWLEVHAMAGAHSAALAGQQQVAAGDGAGALKTAKGLAYELTYNSDAAADRTQLAYYQPHNSPRGVDMAALPSLEDKPLLETGFMPEAPKAHLESSYNRRLPGGP
jgi:hypothetical protein